MGPFGSFPALPFLERLVYWGSVIALAIVLIAVLRAMAIQILGPNLHPFQLDAILVPTFAVLYTPPLYFATVRAAGATHPFSLFQTGLLVVGVSLLLIAVREVLHLRAPGLAPVNSSADTTQPETAGSAEQRPPLLDRLPEDLHGPLLAISGSNHYVDVRTTQGQTSVLLRFSDALREVDGVPGQRVHRSHWVSDIAVTHLRREGNRQFVVLHTGCELPVSRTYAQSAADRWGAPREGFE